MRQTATYRQQSSPLGAATLRFWLALIAGAAVSLALMWAVWHGWRWGFRQVLPGGPAWLTEPAFTAFVIAWLTPSAVALVVARRRSRTD